MTVIRAPNTNGVLGSGTYYAIKKLADFTASSIILIRVGKNLVEYQDEGQSVKRMAVLEIRVELTQKGFDEAVISGMAMLPKEHTGVRTMRQR